jgi:hypothetical protein
MRPTDLYNPKQVAVQSKQKKVPIFSCEYCPENIKDKASH